MNKRKERAEFLSAAISLLFVCTIFFAWIPSASAEPPEKSAELERPAKSEVSEQVDGESQTEVEPAHKEGSPQTEKPDVKPVLPGDFKGAAPPPLHTILTPEVVEKLSQEQLYNLLQEWQQDMRRAEMRRGLRRHDDMHGVPENVMALAVSIVVPVTLFMCILGIIIAVIIYKARKDKQLQITLRAMVEKGVSIPTELIAPPQKKRNDRRKGILLLAAGLGVSIGLAFIGIWDEEALRGAGVGLVLVCLGVGYLIVSRMGGGNNGNGAESISEEKRTIET